jgi:NAD(P)-dependent dehydrogenase (short-subunit alcohol dehydrogenase family)
MGRTIAVLLARAGMDVVIGCHRSARDAWRALADVTATGARATAIRAREQC